MNKIEQLQKELQKAIPRNVYNRVAWVIERKHWDDIEVAMFMHHKAPCIIHVAKEDWLNGVTVARICLEAM